MHVAMIDPSLFTLPYDSRLLGGLRRLGHTATLHGRKPAAQDPAATDVVIEADFYRFAGRPAVARLPRAVRLGVKSLDHVWSMTRLVRVLRRRSPDVIHFQWLPLPFVDIAMLSALRRIAPLVLTVHDTDPFNGDPTSVFQRHAMERCQRQFDRLIVHTKQGEARLKAQGSGSRLAVLPHGLLTELPAPGGPDRPDQELTFVLFGKLKRYKGADLLLEAFANLPSQMRARARVRIVGKPYMDLGPLHRLAEERGIASRVSIEPVFVPDEDVGGLFGANTVAVFPYREIEASGVLFVALAHGRPVVASRLGSFAELITDGVNGHLTEPGDVPALTGALAGMIQDRAFTASCGVASREAAASIMDWTGIARLTEAVYREAGAGRRAYGREVALAA